MTQPPRPNNPGYERGYNRSEPGYALAGYLHHVEGAVWECSDGLDGAGSPSPSVDAGHRQFLLNADFVNSQKRFQPYIDNWRVELVEVSRRLGLLPEVSPLLNEMEAALVSLWGSAAEAKVVRPNGLPLSDDGAMMVVTGQKPAPPGMNQPDWIDTRPMRAHLAAAFEMIERIQKLWPHFDPAAERVDVALVPWERAYALAVEINNGINDAIQKTAPDSTERLRAIEKLGSSIEQDLVTHWTLAVRHALNDDLAKKVDDACRRVRDAARRASENGIRTPQRGDKEWVERWTELNDAVLAMQDLRALQRRAVDQARGIAKPRSDAAFTEAQWEWFRIQERHERELREAGAFAPGGVPVGSPEHTKLGELRAKHERELSGSKFGLGAFTPQGISLLLDMLKLSGRDVSVDYLWGLARQAREVDPTLAPLPMRVPVEAGQLRQLEDWLGIAAAKRLDSASFGDPKLSREQTAQIEGAKPNKMPSERAWIAWRLRQLTGITDQTEIATKMTEQGYPANQGQVSRWLRQVTRFREAGGVMPPPPDAIPPAVSVDPADIEMGEEQQGRSKYQRGRPDDEENDKD